MRILVDTAWCGRHGIGRFSTEVLCRLDGIVSVRVPLKPAHPLYPLALSACLARERGDVFFSPGFAPPLHISIPYVLTLHDLIHLDSARRLRRTMNRVYYQTAVRRGLRLAASTLTVSAFTQTRIAEWSHIRADRVVVVGNGVSHCFYPQGERADIGRPYILHVGAHAPHKNLPRLVAAFARSGLAAGMWLVFTGQIDKDLMRQAARAGVSHAVRYVGEVSDELLAAFYRGATLLALPSLSEGFGLPAIEAMACGTPVVASRAGALPETVGSAALLVDPLSVSDVAVAMRRVAGDQAFRARMCYAGLLNAARFTWDAVADRVRTELTRAAGQGS